MKRVLRIILFIISLLLLALLYKLQTNRSRVADELTFLSALPKTISLKSAAFEDGGNIPVEYTGNNPVSPPLSWSNLPEGTKSLAIVVTDYDAPSPAFKLFTAAHWDLYNIPHYLNAIEQGISKEKLDSLHITVGKNMAGNRNYLGPQPPFGVHNYYFRIYALDFNSLFLKNDNRDELLKAIKGHVLAYGELVGRF